MNRKGPTPLEFLREHKAVIIFRFIRLRSLYAMLLKGSPVPPHLVCSLLTRRAINHMKNKKNKMTLTLQLSFGKLVSHYINWNSLKPLNPFFPQVSSLPEHPYCLKWQGDTVAGRIYTSVWRWVYTIRFLIQIHQSQSGTQQWSLKPHIPSSPTTLVLSDSLPPLTKAPYANFRVALSEINDNWLIKYA